MASTAPIMIVIFKTRLRHLFLFGVGWASSLGFYLLIISYFPARERFCTYTIKGMAGGFRVANMLDSDCIANEIYEYLLHLTFSLTVCLGD
jgi:hypothetical protein